jgi:two-component system, chemotaxis family, protein-glutamate methylesterase/glutaminase
MSERLPGSVTVLIVEDSPVIAELLRSVLSADPAIRVVGIVGDGEAAFEATRTLRPAVITMDIHMPKLNGFDATRRIMESCPTPIVIVSGSAGAASGHDEVHAVAAGAVAMVPRPGGPGDPAHAESARKLVDIVKLMSEVKLVRRWPRGPEPRAIAPVPVPTGSRKTRIVAIGASTGGPLVLQSILGALPGNLPAPLMIVQHMAPGFIDSFVQWLGQSTGFPVHLAAEGERMVAGHAYVAPDGRHMGIRADGSVLLSDTAPENGVRPAVSFLFRSLSDTLAPHAVAVLLTGMGRDGVDELKRLRQAGALTIAQDKQSSVVFGMPGQAVEAGAVSHVLPPDGIAGLLAGLAFTPSP